MLSDSRSTSVFAFQHITFFLKIALFVDVNILKISFLMNEK